MLKTRDSFFKKHNAKREGPLTEKLHKTLQTNTRDLDYSLQVSYCLRLGIGVYIGVRFCN